MKRGSFMKNHSLLRLASVLLVLLLMLATVTSCMTNRHTVGNGAQTGVTQTSRQWYALWGLVRLGDRDTKTIAEDTPDYTVETYYGFVDWLINFFLGGFTIQSRTIKVTK